MVAWTLDAYDRIGATLVKSGLAFEALTARWSLNAPGSLEVDFNVYADLGGAALGQNELQLKRAGTCVWAGPWLGSDVDARAKDLKVTAEGLWIWFRSRVVTSDLVYSGVEQHTIGWNLLNHTQGQTFGSLGITNGTANGTAHNRNRFYCAAARPNIGDEVEAFTELDDGFDFEIDPATRAFNTWAPQRKAASGITLDGTKVDRLTYTEDVRGQLTFVTGIGSDDCGPVIAEASDTGLANTYGRKHASVEPDLDESSEVAAVAREELRAAKQPRFDASVIFREGGTGAPAWADLVVGNTLVLSDDRGYGTFTKTLRIVEKAVHLDNGLPNQPVIELVLSSAVD
jgi:hypothetical protein